MKASIVASTSDIMISIANISKESDLKDVKDEQLSSGNHGIIAISQGQTTGTELAATEAHANTATDGTKITEPEIELSRQLRIAAVGSSHLATNRGIRLPENKDLAMNLSNYLLQDEDYISIRPKTESSTTLNLGSIWSELYLVLGSFLYPQLFLGLGIFFWALRRRS